MISSDNLGSIVCSGRDVTSAYLVGAVVAKLTDLDAKSLAEAFEDLVLGCSCTVSGTKFVVDADHVDEYNTDLLGTKEKSELLEDIGDYLKMEMAEDGAAFVVSKFNKFATNEHEIAVAYREDGGDVKVKLFVG